MQNISTYQTHAMMSICISISCSCLFVFMYVPQMFVVDTLVNYINENKFVVQNKTTNLSFGWFFIIILHVS